VCCETESESPRRTGPFAVLGLLVASELRPPAQGPARWERTCQKAPIGHSTANFGIPSVRIGSKMPVNFAHRRKFDTANLPPFVIAAFTEKKVQATLSDASRSATQTLNEAPDPAVISYVSLSDLPHYQAGEPVVMVCARSLRTELWTPRGRFISAYPFRLGMRVSRAVSGSCWVLSAGPSEPQGWRGLRAGPPAAAPMDCFLWRPARLVGFPLGACRRESHNLVVCTPRQQTVTVYSGGVPLPETREEASPSRRSARRTRPRKAVQKNCSLLATKGACSPEWRAVTTILSGDGRSPRMTFRMCRISSRRGATARRPEHLARST